MVNIVKQDLGIAKQNSQTRAGMKFSQPRTYHCFIHKIPKIVSSILEIRVLRPSPFWSLLLLSGVRILQRLRSLTSKSRLRLLFLSPSMDTVGVNRFLPPVRSQLGVGPLPHPRGLTSVRPSPKQAAKPRAAGRQEARGKQCIGLKRTSCSIRLRVPWISRRSLPMRRPQWGE